MLVTAKHSTSGANAGAECNGIVSWIEVQKNIYIVPRLLINTVTCFIFFQGRVSEIIRKSAFWIKRVSLFCQNALMKVVHLNSYSLFSLS